MNYLQELRKALNTSRCYRWRYRRLTISITVIGEAEMKTKSLSRNFSNKTDLLVVTADIGAAYMDYSLEREKASFLCKS
jgi:thiamine monophosphate kinase